MILLNGFNLVNLSENFKYIIWYPARVYILGQIANVKGSIKKQLNQDFAKICDWLDIHFGDDKNDSWYI